MNDEPPEIFARVTPRGAPSELRARVLSAVDRQLADKSDASADPASGAIAGLSSSACRAQAGSRWERVLEIAVAASLVVGVGSNLWQWRRYDEWQARVYGPPPISAAIAELAATVESVTDAQTAQAVVERFSAGRASRRSSEQTGLPQYNQLLNELTGSKSGSTL
jgi:hypothetical protein